MCSRVLGMFGSYGTLGFCDLRVSVWGLRLGVHVGLALGFKRSILVIGTPGKELYFYKYCM